MECQGRALGICLYTRSRCLCTETHVMRAMEVANAEAAKELDVV